MNMFQDLDEINTILREDVDLWKLMYHKSEHIDDDPLKKEDVLSLPLQERVPIINLRLKHTPVTNDLVDLEICRIIFYQASRNPQRGNYKVARQEVNFDILVHRNINDVDMRLAKICDRVNDLISNKHIVGFGKTEFIDGRPFTLANEGYFGYTLTYAFGSLT